MLDYILMGSYDSGQGGGIAAIQTVTGSTTGTSLTLTFGSLTDASKCVPFMSCYISSGATTFGEYNPRETWKADVFDDSGTVKCTVTRSLDDSPNATWSFCVTLIQFDSSYTVAKYSGTLTGSLTLGYTNITITSVTPANSFVLGTATDIAAAESTHWLSSNCNYVFRITSGTNVRVYGGFGSTSQCDYVFYVVSDPSGGMVVESQFAQIAAGSTALNRDLTFSTLDPTACLLVASSKAFRNTGQYTQRVSQSCEALNSTTVRFSRKAGVADATEASRFGAQAISIPGVTVQHGVHAWAVADNSEVKTVTSVDTARSAAISTIPGHVANGNNNGPSESAARDYAMTRVQLTSATQVTLTRRSSAGSDDGRIGYQVISF